MMISELKHKHLAMGPAQEVHRSGLWKQSNKEHKSGRHKSKGAVDRINRGRICGKVGDFYDLYCSILAKKSEFLTYNLNLHIFIYRPNSEFCRFECGLRNIVKIKFYFFYKKKWPILMLVYFISK